MEHWEPAGPSEMRGKWRGHYLNPEGVTFYDLIEIEHDELFTLPKNPELRAQLKALDPDDGDLVAINFDGMSYRAHSESG